MNYSESYNFKFDNKMLDVLVLFSDTSASMFVRVEGALDKYDKIAFTKVCLAVNTLLKANIFDYKQHHMAINKLSSVDANIINFFERNIFALLKIA